MEFSLQLALLELYGGDARHELLSELSCDALHLLEEHVEGLRAERVPDPDGDHELHELVKQHKEPVELCGLSGEDPVDAQLENDKHERDV